MNKNMKAFLLTSLIFALALSGCAPKQTPNTAIPKQPAPQTGQITPGTATSPAPGSTTPQQVSPTTPAPTTPSPASKPSPTAPAPTTPSPAPKPATQAPATTASSRGQALYTAQCVNCHGANAVGGSAPSLKATPSKYGTQSALASYIQSHMPLTSPNSLTSSQANDLAAYLFSIGK